MYPLSVLRASLLEPEQTTDHRDRAPHITLSVSPLHGIHLTVSFGSWWRRVYSLQKEAAVVG
jgi:hypothetical protein